MSRSLPSSATTLLEPSARPRASLPPLEWIFREAYGTGWVALREGARRARANPSRKGPAGQGQRVTEGPGGPGPTRHGRARRARANASRKGPAGQAGWPAENPIAPGPGPGQGRPAPSQGNPSRTATADRHGPRRRPGSDRQGPGRAAPDLGQQGPGRAAPSQANPSRTATAYRTSKAQGGPHRTGPAGPEAGTVPASKARGGPHRTGPTGPGSP
ncbi:hypothetical protein GCM10009577_13240 [Streptomyces javensis]